MVDDLTPNAVRGAPRVDESLVTYTHATYALHALAVLIGITGSATVVGSFVGGIPSIVAVIMNYLRKSAVRGTFLESHFRWQIRTFWFALLWAVVVFVIGLPLLAVLVGFILLPLGLAALGIWIMYRVVRGWIALRDRRPMYV
jgi:uncharacterized membrane protein